MKNIIKYCNIIIIFCLLETCIPTPPLRISAEFIIEKHNLYLRYEQTIQYYLRSIAIDRISNNETNAALFYSVSDDTKGKYADKIKINKSTWFIIDRIEMNCLYKFTITTSVNFIVGYFILIDSKNNAENAIIDLENIPDEIIVLYSKPIVLSRG